MKFPYTFLIVTAVVFLMSGRACCENNKFPKDFLFGVASSAYQIEGGHEHRGETVFDYFQSLNKSMIFDSSDAKIACDSYNKYKEDIALLDDLGVDFYRFSIAWSRILPSGFSNQINPDGIRYYNNLIDGLLAKNIQPMVTILHLDLPKQIQDLGGLANPVLADFFEDYARILFENFGDRVKYWITQNVNILYCGTTEWPPMLNQSGMGEYLCLKTTLLSHARVYHLYKTEFSEEQKGQIGLTVDGRWFEPGSDLQQDLDAAEQVREFLIGTITNPIFGNGDFPQIVKDRVDGLSKEEGFLRSRLPKLSPDEQKYIKGSADFLGFNIYTTFLVKRLADGAHHGYSYDKDVGALLYQDPKWPGSKSAWLKVVPSGMRKVLKWFKEKYNNPIIFITENGFSDDGQIDDVGRINYYQLYLKALLEAIHEDGVRVKGYAAWSLLDNFEWLMGYTEHFGLHHVDFSDPDRKRTPKSSAKWYKKLIERRQLDDAITSNTFKTEL